MRHPSPSTIDGVAHSNFSVLWGARILLRDAPYRSTALRAAGVLIRTDAWSRNRPAKSAIERPAPRCCPRPLHLICAVKRLLNTWSPVSRYWPPWAMGQSPELSRTSMRFGSSAGKKSSTRSPKAQRCPVFVSKNFSGCGENYGRAYRSCRSSCSAMHATWLAAKTSAFPFGLSSAIGVALHFACRCTDKPMIMCCTAQETMIIPEKPSKTKGFRGLTCFNRFPRRQPTGRRIRPGRDGPMIHMATASESGRAFPIRPTKLVFATSRVEDESPRILLPNHSPEPAQAICADSRHKCWKGRDLREAGRDIQPRIPVHQRIKMAGITLQVQPRCSDCAKGRSAKRFDGVARLSKIAITPLSLSTLGVVS